MNGGCQQERVLEIRKRKEEEKKGRKEGGEGKEEATLPSGRLHLPMVRFHSLLQPGSDPVAWDLLLRPVMKTCLWLAKNLIIFANY